MGRRPNQKRGADSEEDPRLPGKGLSRQKAAFRDPLSKEDGVHLEEPPAGPTIGGELSPFNPPEDLRPLQTEPAGEASHSMARPVELDEAFSREARLLVEAIGILGDEGREGPQAVEFAQSEVSGVGPCLPDPGVKPLAHLPVPPSGLGVLKEVPVTKNLPVDLSPDPPFPPEGGDPRLGPKPRPSEGHALPLKERGGHVSDFPLQLEKALPRTSRKALKAVSPRLRVSTRTSSIPIQRA